MRPKCNLTNSAAGRGAPFEETRSPARRASSLALILAQRACLRAALGLLAVLMFVDLPARAAVTEAWVHRYSNMVGNSYDEAFAVVRDAAGDIIVIGYTEEGITGKDMLTIKYSSADGSVLWQQRYNGPANGDDRAGAVAVDGSGNVVVTGPSIGNEGYYDYYTAKYAAADGVLLWEKRYNGPANSYDFANAVAVDGSGNVVVTGSSGEDYYTAKYAAADGALLWEKRYDGPRNRGDEASAVAVDGSGNVVVTGKSDISCNAMEICKGDYYTAKYAAADGALIWEQRYGGASSNDRANAVAVDGSGNVVVTGTASGDYYTAKYAAADGALIWEQRYNGPANSYDSATAVAVDGSGNVVVTGSFYNGTNTDYYTAKYAAADGALLWEKRYHGPANGDDHASSLALGPNGMVAITGSSSGDYATVVYRDDVYRISIALVPAGVRLSFIGIPGRRYTIERALAVTGPWSILATPNAPVSGLIEYVDTNSSVVTAFYRTSAP